MALKSETNGPLATDLSVIIVNWNTRNILRDCMKSVYEQTCGIAFEVIVIDNASSDGSAIMVKDEFPQAILIENTENRGFAAANNQGMKIAKGRYVLLLNSDTIVLDGALQKTLAFAVRHPEAAVVGCRVLNPDKTLQSTCFMFPSLLNMFLSSTYLYKLFPASRFFGREQMAWWDRNDVREVEVVTGCFMLVRQEAISQVGMMDDSYFMYAEETDWCYRFKKGGWRNIFYPDALIVHLGGQSSKKIRPEMILQARSGILYFIKMHYSYLSYLLCCLLFSLHALFRVPYWLFQSMIASDKSYAVGTLRAYLKGVVCPLGGWKALCCKKEK